MFKVAKYLLVSFFLLASIVSEAQYSKRKAFNSVLDGLALSPRGGVNIFYGDLVDDSRTSYSFGLAVDKDIWTFMTVRLQGMGGNMKGLKTLRETDVLETQFTTKYYDLSLGGTLRILDLTSGYFPQRELNPYFLAQLGVVHYNSENWYGPGGYRPNELRMIKKGFSPIFKGGFGLSFRLSDKIRANIEYSGFFVMGDLMDGYDRWFYDSPQGTQSVKTDDNDFYYTATAGLSFMIRENVIRSSSKYGRKAYSKKRRKSSKLRRKKKLR